MKQHEPEACLSIRDSASTTKSNSDLKKYLSTAVKAVIPLGSARRTSSDGKGGPLAKTAPFKPPPKPRPCATLLPQSPPARGLGLEPGKQAPSPGKTAVRGDTQGNHGSRESHSKAHQPSVVFKKFPTPQLKVGKDDKLMAYSAKAQPAAYRGSAISQLKDTHCGQNGEQGRKCQMAAAGSCRDRASDPRRHSVPLIRGPLHSPCSPQGSINSMYQKNLQPYHREREEKRRILEKPKQPVCSPVSPSHRENGSLEHKKFRAVTSNAPVSKLQSMKTSMTQPLITMPSGRLKRSLSYSSSTDRCTLLSMDIPPVKRKRDLATEDRREGKRHCVPESGRGASSGIKATNTGSDYIQQAFLKATDNGVLKLKEKSFPKVAESPAFGTKHTELGNKSPPAFSQPPVRWLFPQVSHEHNREMKENHKTPSDTLKRKAKTIDHKDLKYVFLQRMAKVSKGGSVRDESPRVPSDSDMEGCSSSQDITGPWASQNSASSPESKVRAPGDTLHSDTALSPVPSTVENAVKSPPSAALNCKRSSPSLKNVGDSVSPHRVPDPSPKSGPLSSTDSPEKASEDGASLDKSWHSPSGGNCASSSDSESEDEQLLSLQEILALSAKPPATPEKGAYSAPGTPVSSAALYMINNRPLSYKNSLERMLKEKEENQRVKEIEMKLILSCKEDISKLAEEAEMSTDEEETISQEHRDFVQKFSIVPDAIPDLHPGEEVFALANFGKLFNQHSLDLRNCGVVPQNGSQKVLFQTHPRQQLLLIGLGLLTNAYRATPCQPAVSRWLFQMMSVHSDRKISAQILKAMKDMALTAAQQIVEHKSRKFQVWMPPVQDVSMVFLNMGVPFVSLFPLEVLQPDFSEVDVVKTVDVFTEEVQNGSTHSSDVFPEHNFVSVIKYLVLCSSLCPQAYSDQELLLLLCMICRVSLEKQLRLLPVKDLRCLLLCLVNSTRDWDSKLPQICLILTDLTDHHHNLRRLVRLLPDNRRGRQLRKHLSLSIISKLLNHRCTYKATNTDLQLSDLRLYLFRMKPSLLSKGIAAAKKVASEGLQHEEESSVSVDQQAYYLCCSLLALTNEVTNFESIPSGQKEHLMILSTELEKHIKCDIRESEKRLYRSKVKDFVARIYTKWQVLLQKSRPMQGKLYDYWEPLPEDMVATSSEPGSNATSVSTEFQLRLEDSEGSP
ncbi:SLF2 protein, partial [Amia calva]|nr:SLF2 protein [Amia calva]